MQGPFNCVKSAASGLNHRPTLSEHKASEATPTLDAFDAERIQPSSPPKGEGEGKGARESRTQIRIL